MEEKKNVGLAIDGLELELILDALNFFDVALEEANEDLCKDEKVALYITGLRVRASVHDLMEKLESAKKIMESEESPVTSER